MNDRANFRPVFSPEKLPKCAETVFVASKCDLCLPTFVGKSVMGSFIGVPRVRCRSTQWLDPFLLLAIDLSQAKTSTENMSTSPEALTHCGFRRAARRLTRPTGSPQLTPFPARFLMGLCLASLFLAPGCAHKRQYLAEDLPQVYQAPPVENPQTIDLTKLATSTITQDLIGGGDVIEVSISAGLASDDTSTFPVRVTDAGIAQLPVVGPVELTGMDLEEAEAVIAHACINKGLYTAPHITVTMKRPKVHRITVLGAVEEPATYELRSGQADVLQAIVAAGGLSEEASSFIQIRHPGYQNGGSSKPRELIANNPEGDGVQSASAEMISEPLPVQTGGATAVRINLASAATENPNALKLEDGGIVMVEKRDPKPIHVIGLVRKPDRYDFPITEELRMLDAIALAGGTDNPLADKVYVIRANPKGGEPILVEGSIRKAKRNGKADMVLAPGDVVSLEQTPGTSLFEALRLIGFGISGRAF